MFARPLPSFPLQLSIGAAPRASIGSRRNPASTRAILDAAASLLARDGIAAFSIDAIARLARCGKPTVYRWWPDKLALLIDLHALEVDALPAAHDAAEAAAGWGDALRAFWSTTLAGPLVRAMVGEAQLAADGRRRLREAFAPYVSGLGDAEPSLARAIVGQAIFAWLCDDAATVVALSTFVTPPAAVTPARKPVYASVRHRGEWVD